MVKNCHVLIKKNINFSEKGFEFLSNLEVNVCNILTMTSWKDYGNSSVHKYKYKTNLQFIFIQDKNTIDRRTLEIDYGIGIERNL